jgi:endonuclease VIII
MPEGDTIHRAGRNLGRALQGRAVTGGPAPLRGQTVAAVEARGKHLLIWFDPSDLALHSHMRMRGSWHLYRPGERWRRPRASARIAIETDEWVAVCFGAPVCDLLTRRQVERHPVLSALGPDALDDATDLADAARRLGALPGREIGTALLDQRVLAGVGNVYRCEVLFLCGIDPWTAVGDLGAADRLAALRTAERLLKENADRVGRNTTGRRSAPLYVYGRAGRPCLRCDTPIRVARQGTQARVTYWCPRCQG